VCKCVLYHCHRLSTQLQLTNISYHISYHITSYHIRTLPILFLGAFAKLRKATMSFVMSVCPYEIILPTGVNFWECDTWALLKNLSRMFKSHQSLTFLQKVTGTSHEDLCTFMIQSRSVLLRTRNFSGKRYRENQNTHFVLNKFFSESCRLWGNVEEYGRAKQATNDNSIIPRMRFACWITKAADAHSEYVIIIAFLWQKLFRRQASILLFYVNYLSCCIMWPSQRH
jgi:hypothetical protein